jgi:hypothetical protein
VKKILVTKRSSAPDSYIVELQENEKEFQYIVTLEPSYQKELGVPELTPEELIKQSFEFLLKREGPESILGSFNLKEIEKYFPEFRSFFQNS